MKRVGTRARSAQSFTAEVLLAGALDRPGLAVARSLSRHGIRFVVVGDEPKGMIAASRHVRRYLQAPAPWTDPDAFVNVVLDAVSRNDVRLVMPMSDAALVLCNQHREAFSPGTTLAAAPSPAVQNVLDKRLNLETASRLGIPCPVEFKLESLQQVPELIDRLGFPMVLKNSGYGSGAKSRAFDFKWLIAHNKRGLDTLLERHCTPREFPLFQEFVRGNVRNLCCFAASGRTVAMHEFRVIRQLAWEGNGVLREITAPTPHLAEYAERLLRDLRWDGVAQVAFIVRESDGDARYMETNGRYWGSVEGSIRIGWDFPYWTYRYFTKGEVPSPPPLEIGSRSCWHYGDLRLLAKRLQGREPPLAPRPSKFRAVVDYVTGFQPGIQSDVFRLDDPLPALVEHWSGLRPAVARRIRRFG
jgi:predicted ATP-grasp superfamily ATP-dependent carboligase